VVEGMVDARSHSVKESIYHCSPACLHGGSGVSERDEAKKEYRQALKKAKKGTLWPMGRRMMYGLPINLLSKGLQLGYLEALAEHCTRMKTKLCNISSPLLMTQLTYMSQTGFS